MELNALVCRLSDRKSDSAEARRRRERKTRNFPMLKALTQLLIQEQW